MFEELINQINQGKFDREKVIEALKHKTLDYPTDYYRLCYAACEADGMLLQFSQISRRTFPQISLQICTVAVRQNGLALQYVKYQTEYIQLAALQQNLDAYVFIKDPSPIVKQYYEEQKAAIQKHDDLWNTGLLEKEPAKKVKGLVLNDDFLDKLLEKSKEYYESVLHRARNELKQASKQGRLHGGTCIHWDLDETDNVSRALEILQENITSTRISVSASDKRISMSIRE